MGCTGLVRAKFTPLGAPRTRGAHFACDPSGRERNEEVQSEAADVRVPGRHTRRARVRSGIAGRKPHSRGAAEANRSGAAWHRRGDHRTGDPDAAPEPHPGARAGIAAVQRHPYRVQRRAFRVRIREAAVKTNELEKFYELIDGIEAAMMTTRRLDGHLQSRPMATQKRANGAD